jgi:Domain of unknown function (DUF4440)
MKRHLPLAALLVFVFAAFCSAQPQATASPTPAPKPKPRMTNAQLLRKLSASETKLWEAWKNKDAKPFQLSLSSEGIMISEQGVGTKKDVVNMMSSMPCEVTSFTLTDWKLTMVDPNTAILTYKGAADGTCQGQPIPTVWASSLWVNRRGRWLAFSHQETPVK